MLGVAARVKLCALLLAVAIVWATTSPARADAPAGNPTRVVLVIDAPPDEAEAFFATLSELLHRLGLILERQSDIASACPTDAGVLTIVDARLWQRVGSYRLLSPEDCSVMVKQRWRPRESQELLREELALMLQALIEAVALNEPLPELKDEVAEGTEAVSAQVLRPLPNTPLDPPSAPPTAPPSCCSLGFGAFSMAYATSMDSAPILGLGGSGFVGGETPLLAWRLWLLGGGQLPRHAEVDGFGLELSGTAVDMLAILGSSPDRAFSLGAAGGVGIRFARVEPVTAPSTWRLSSETTWREPNVKLGALAQARLSASMHVFALALGEVALREADYTIGDAGSESTLLSEWRVRPRILVGLSVRSNPD